MPLRSVGEVYELRPEPCGLAALTASSASVFDSAPEIR
jgi:hypothetical protein